jgi:ketosteroid isomerase-like protein
VATRERWDTLETRLSMNDTTAVRRAVDRLLEGAVGPLLELLAEDVEFEVAGGGDVYGHRKEWGKRAVGDYFAGLRGLVAFWQMDYTAAGEQVIAWGKESFTIEHCGLEGGCELALVFDLSEGRITRFLMIEDLRSFMRGSSSPIEASRIGARAAARERHLLRRAHSDGAGLWSSAAGDRHRDVAVAEKGVARLK